MPCKQIPCAKRTGNLSHRKKDANRELGMGLRCQPSFVAQIQLQWEQVLIDLDFDVEITSFPLAEMILCMRHGSPSCTGSRSLPSTDPPSAQHPRIVCCATIPAFAVIVERSDGLDWRIAARCNLRPGGAAEVDGRAAFTDHDANDPANIAAGARPVLRR